MESRYSIQDVIRIFDTGGSYPLLITCDDLQNWVCKYERNTLNLFNEFLAYRFAELWGLRLPDIAQVTVHERHLPLHMQHRLQPHLFRKVCFGSKFIENSSLISLTSLSSFQNYNFRKKIVNKSDFLKIALFDLWLANEDRNHNNFNMLLEFVGNKIYFICPIDHVTLFNSAHLNYPIVSITDFESIINTSLAQALFKTDRRLGEYVNEIIENFYLCTTACEQQLLDILSIAPISWNIDIPLLERRLKENVFSDEWKQQCVSQFRELVHQYIVL